MDNILDDLFSTEEYAIFNSISVDAVDLNELEKHGKVRIDEATDPETQIVTKSVHFESWDGKTKFTKVKSYHVATGVYEKVKELNDLIAFAIVAENYEKAAAYKQQKDLILLNNN